MKLSRIDLIYLKPGQILNILPVDGTYYEWQGTESLTKVAEVFGVDPESIVNFPGNHLDPDTIGDLEQSEYSSRHLVDRPGRETRIHFVDSTGTTGEVRPIGSCLGTRGMQRDQLCSGRLWQLRLPHH